jgi:hypothetical protein
MNARFTRRIRAARLLAVVAVVGACALAAAAAPAGAHGSARSAHGAAGKTITLRYYSEVVGFVYRRADGTVAQQPSQNPAAGDQLEVTELAYKGTHKSHAKKPSASTYTVCVFKAAKGEPACEGAAALGGSQLLIFHTAPGSDPVIVGGTGRYMGATGGAAMTEIANSNNSDIVITVNLRK